MAVWQDFEKNCCDYLNRKYGSYAMFDCEGGADSTRPDIYVRTKNGKSFYIEAKHCPAQCGQFVLIPDISTEAFVYSPLNDTPINSFARAIMQHMNADFESFKEAGTSGKDIIMENGSQVFANWIIDHYKNKGTKFFITNNYVIFPIEEFAQYFYVTAKYRIKRSGSSSVGKGSIPFVKRVIDSLNLPITNYRVDDSKLFVSCSKYIHDVRFRYNGYEYMFSQRGSEYEIRKLSNTFNANVIFSIDLKHTINGANENQFIAYLR